MARNSNLNAAARAKKDEFYTQKSDIENELRHYKKFFAGKIVFCNCDDPYESEFFKYFAMNFNSLGLRKLIATCFKGSPVAGREISLFEPLAHGFKAEISALPGENGDGKLSIDYLENFIRSSGVIQQLQDDGDFRSSECVALLRQADVVVTNPPFSLFREYVAQLMKYEKKFLIIGHQNAITYKEFFPLIMQNKVWLGYGFKGNAGFFYSDYEDTATSSQHREGMIRVSGVTWYTNIDHDKRHEDIPLAYRYSPEKYPRYDNYDAIEVSKVLEIPIDYDGVMGVPITFLGSYNPDKFEILDARDFALKDKLRKKSTYLVKDADGTINGKAVYVRILIRRKRAADEN